MSIHIIPLNDLKDHEENTLCECEHELMIVNGEMIFIHNSYDGREGVEAAVEILNKTNL